jgi:hypothetical protein
MSRDNGTKIHTTRPPSGTAARIAWDIFTAEHGPLEDMKLIDGWWMCMTKAGEVPQGIDGITARYENNLKKGSSP